MGSIYILLGVNALMHNFYKWESHMHNPGMGSLLNFSEKKPPPIYIFLFRRELNLLGCVTT